ncbi:hypothetical protein HY407_03775 [Candidatus Gottesmanbacteria bacterium]|nr:hypothetical protein [Candidatus Gottesmanbacteria bacterium]
MNIDKENYYEGQVFRLRSGQAIIEILVAFVLLTFLLSGLVVAGLFAIRNTQYARNRSEANKIASQQLERFRVKRDSGKLADLDECDPVCFIESDLSILKAAKTVGIFTVTSSIDKTPSLGECDLPGSGSVYKVSVNVTWVGSTTHQVSNNTCLTDWR